MSEYILKDILEFSLITGLKPLSLLMGGLISIALLLFVVGLVL